MICTRRWPRNGLPGSRGWSLFRRSFSRRRGILHAIAKRRERKGGEAAIQGEKALAFRRVGDIQVELSRYSEAEKAYRESIAILETLNVTFPIISSIPA